MTFNVTITTFYFILLIKACCVVEMGFIIANKIEAFEMLLLLHEE